MSQEDELKAFCRLRGAALAGIADLTPASAVYASGSAPMANQEGYIVIDELSLYWTDPAAH
ncbi:MAG TPA: hypothetical protein VEI96_10995 [Thermodesulfovibrionales bacterium]|nr:hypothetical protein [Thermodesulfovibrionales bacterium]